MIDNGDNFELVYDGEQWLKPDDPPGIALALALFGLIQNDPDPDQDPETLPEPRP